MWQKLAVLLFNILNDDNNSWNITHFFIDNSMIQSIWKYTHVLWDASTGAMKKASIAEK